ncbi:hypothetical protein BBJ28_00004068 [Nothophytophthora sp. Chile5]|nr:hypothetical protein BBJ28_00004068 [Nothophytophthora sp. Chile5]
MPTGASAGLPASTPPSLRLSLLSSSEHKSDSSSSSSSNSLRPVPWSFGAPATADHVIELSASSEEPPSTWSRRNQPTPPNSTQSASMPWPGRTRSFLRRYSPLALPVALLIALVVLLVQDLATAQDASPDTPDSTTATVIQWSACPLDNVVAKAQDIAAQCTTVEMPLCYDGVCEADNATATISVFFKRIAKASNDTNSTRVWYLPDRPDVQTASDVDLQMTLLYQELDGDVDIYTMTLRGSGNSTALECNTSDAAPLQEAIFARNDGAIDADDVQNCASQLQATGYTNLSAFSLSSAARDLEQIITQYQTDAQVVVYALGYGTLVAQRLMQLGVSQISGYVLDGALDGSPESSLTSSSSPETEESMYQVSKSDADFGQVADEFLTWCQTDVNCSTMFPSTSSTTTLNATLLEVYVRLDADTASMCAMMLTDSGDSSSSSSSSDSATPPSFVLRQLLAQMLENATLRAFIPVVAYRFHRCGSEDLTLLSEFVTTSFETAAVGDDNGNIPDLVYAIQAFSELWEQPTPDQIELTERFTNATISAGREYSQLEAYCLFTSDTSAACMAVEGSNSASTASSSVGFTLAYDRDALATNTSGTVIPTGASVLLLSGELDALSPLKYAESLYNALQGDKALLVAPNGTHGVVQTALSADGTACARQVLASYVRNRGDLSVYNASCIAELPTPSLAISNVSSLLVLGVVDAYDGELVLSSGSGSATIEIIPSTSNSGSSETSSSSDSALDDANRRIAELESSRDRYELAMIVVASVLGALLLVGLLVLIYKRHRKRQIVDEEAMLRRMRGEEEDELELMRSLYLLSSSPPSSGGRRAEGGRRDDVEHDI